MIWHMITILGTYDVAACYHVLNLGMRVSSGEQFQGTILKI